MWSTSEQKNLYGNDCLGLQSYPSIGTKKGSRNSIETEGSKYSLLSKLFIYNCYNLYGRIWAEWSGAVEHAFKQIHTARLNSLKY